MNLYVSVKIVYTKNAFIIGKENEIMIKETQKSKSQAGCCCPQNPITEALYPCSRRPKPFILDSLKNGSRK